MNTTDSNIQELISDSFANFKSSFEPGEKIKGVVSSITKANVFVDINAKGEGVIDKNEFLKDGELTIKPGDEIETYFAGMGKGNELLLTVSQPNVDKPQPNRNDLTLKQRDASHQASESS